LHVADGVAVAAAAAAVSAAVRLMRMGSSAARSIGGNIG